MTINHIQDKDFLFLRPYNSKPGVSIPDTSGIARSTNVTVAVALLTEGMAV